MTTKVLVGLNKKRGLPEFGSIGAACQIEIELDTRVLENDPGMFRRHVQRAYNACRESVEAELTKEPSNGSHCGNGKARQPANESNRSRQTATAKQISAIQAIADRKGVDLVPLLKRFNVTTANQLCIKDASFVLDELTDDSKVVASSSR